MRNMQYLGEAIEVSGWHSKKSGDPSPVQRWMLNALDIEDTSEKRELLDLHLFTPVRFYAVLLQAEAAYVDESYGAGIAETGHFWTETEIYRDFILHPKRDVPYGVMEAKWLKATSYALEPQLAEIDSYMQKKLAQLRNDISVFANDLPTSESYYVKVMCDRDRKENEDDKDSAVDNIDIEGIEHLERVLALPRSHIDDLNRLVTTLIKAHPPHRLEGKYELGKLRLPDASYLQAVSARASAKTDLWLPDEVGRKTSRVLDNLTSYGLLFDFAGVFVSVDTESDTRLLYGCAGLACAIMVSVLEAYDSIIQENPSAVRSELRFDAKLWSEVRQLRRSVFHVETIDDNAWDDVMNGTLDFGLGIREFLADLLSYEYRGPSCDPTAGIG